MERNFIRNVWEVLRREIRIIRQRPIYLLASVGVIIVNAVFYLTFFGDGLPHDLPVGVVDEDHSSTSRNFTAQLESTQLSHVIFFEDVHAARERSVDEIFALAIAIHAPGDGYLIVIHGKRTIRIVEHERYFGDIDAPALARTREDDIFHHLTAEVLCIALS